MIFAIMHKDSTPNFIAHEGIKGMKPGVRHEPYPIDAATKAAMAAEAEAEVYLNKKDCEMINKAVKHVKSPIGWLQGGADTKQNRILNNATTMFMEKHINEFNNSIKNSKFMGYNTILNKEAAKKEYANLKTEHIIYIDKCLTDIQKQKGLNENAKKYLMKEVEEYANNDFYEWLRDNSKTYSTYMNNYGWAEDPDTVFEYQY